MNCLCTNIFVVVGDIILHAVTLMLTVLRNTGIVYVIFSFGL